MSRMVQMTQISFHPSLNPKMTLPYTIASSQPRIFNLMIDHGDDSEYNFILKPFT